MGLYIAMLMVYWFHTVDLSEVEFDVFTTRRHQVEFARFYEEHKCCGVYWPVPKECE
jgi:hypothetical protein